MRYVVFYKGNSMDLYYNESINWMMKPERATIFEDIESAKKCLRGLNNEYPDNKKLTDIIKVEEEQRL